MIPNGSSSTSVFCISHINTYIESQQEDVRKLLEKLIDVPLPVDDQLPSTFLPFDSELAIFVDQERLEQKKTDRHNSEHNELKAEIRVIMLQKSTLFELMEVLQKIVTKQNCDLDLYSSIMCIQKKFKQIVRSINRLSNKIDLEDS